VRTYSLTIKNRLTATAVAVGIVGVGVLIVFVGFALLAALTVTGAVLGTGFAAYRWLRGGRAELPRGGAGLDPSLEVQPHPRTLAAPAESTNDIRDEIPPAS
jgi:hypothetical protein